jgi:hypothetical protein
MAYRTIIRSAGDLLTERINVSQQTVNNFTSLRGISTKSQIINVIGTGSFERQTYVAQVDDDLNTIVTTDQTYAYVRHPGTIFASTLDRTNNKEHVLDLRTTVTVDTFGASGAAGAEDSTQAFKDALQWAAVLPGERPIVLVGGVYKVSDTLYIPKGVSIYGRNRNTILFFSGGITKDCIVIGASGSTESGQNRIQNFTIGGSTNCGRYGIYLPNMTANLHVDIDLYGGFAVGIYQRDDTPAATGTLWSTFRLSNINWANFPLPVDYFVNKSFINVRRLLRCLCNSRHCAYACV